jgi:hypothetical protein
MMLQSKNGTFWAEHFITKCRFEVYKTGKEDSTLAVVHDSGFVSFNIQNLIHGEFSELVDFINTLFN